MKTFLSGAIFLSAFGGPLLANGATSDWLGLDEELNSLASAVTLQGSEPSFGALLRANVLMTSDFNGGGPGSEDILGFDLEDAKLWAKGDLGDFSWRIMFDFANEESGTPGGGAATAEGKSYLTDLANANSSSSYAAALQDAYATWDLNEMLTLTFGRFRAPTTRSMWISSDQLLFLHRSLLGEFGYTFDEGVMLSGTYESNFSWHVSAQNGGDGLEDDLRLNGRAEYAFGMPAPMTEGAWVNTDEIEATVGVFIGDDGDPSGTGGSGIDGGYYGLDVTANMGQLAFYGELANLDNGVAAGFGALNGTSYSDDATPWSAAVSYMLSPEEWEVALRYEDLDDASNTNVLTLGANYYMTGHNAKWQLNVITVDSDSNALDGTLFGLGLTLGLEGYDA